MKPCSRKSGRRLRTFCASRDSRLAPHAQQVVIAADERTLRGFVAVGRVQALDGVVEIEEQRALAVVAHEALRPEEARYARAARDGPHLMKTRRGVDDRMTRGQLHFLHT